MDFNAIIDDGLRRRRNRNNLKSFCVRECKKAEREKYYTSEDFYSELLEEVRKHKRLTYSKFEEKHKYLDIQIDLAEKNELGYFELDSKVLENKGISQEEFKKRENKKELTRLLKQKREYTIYDVWITYKMKDLEEFENIIKKLNPSKKDIAKYEELIDLDFLDSYCNVDKNSRVILKQLKEELMLDLKGYVGKDISALAHLIRESSLMHKNKKQTTFKAWNDIFCTALKRKKNYYTPSKVKKEFEKLKKTYYYIQFP